MITNFLKRAFISGIEESEARAERPAARRPVAPEPSSRSRVSNGLRHFLETLPDDRQLEVLDFGPVSASNINFLSRRGCKIHTLDLISSYDQSLSGAPGGRFDRAAAESFIKTYLDFEPEQFSAILAWDTLQHLDAGLLELMIPWIGAILRGGGGLLTFFHTQPRGQTVPLHRYEIEDQQTLRLGVRQSRVLRETFNNRSLERLFADFHSVKFFLTSDNLREVIVVR